MNSKIKHIFEKLIIKVSYEKDKAWTFKVRNYNEVVTILKTYPIEITTIDKAKEMLTVLGKKNPIKILNKINIIINDEPLLFLGDDIEKILAIQTLSSIYGVGVVKAKTLYETYGISNINDVKTEWLNTNQRKGLKHYNDLQKKIPRTEINKYKKIFKEISKELGIRMSINGSYRRKKLYSGDIDVLITGKQFGILKPFIDKLCDIGIITDILAMGKKKSMAIVKLEDNYHRHLDVIETSPISFPFAKLYFTGSGRYNIMMRGKAKKMGYSLNEVGLMKNKKLIDSGVILEKIGKNRFTNEQDIFKFLDIDYVKPKLRI